MYDVGLVSWKNPNFVCGTQTASVAHVSDDQKSFNHTAFLVLAQEANQTPALIRLSLGL
jgi:hypothetical protein